MLRIALLAILLTAQFAQAQVTRFDTYRSNSLYTSNGRIDTSKPIYVPTSGEFEKWKQVTRPYYSLMGDVAATQGYRRLCESDTTKAFLIGNTEAAFRASEKSLVKDFATTTSKHRAPTLLKSLPVRNLGNGISASFYIYQPTRADLKSKNMYGYFYSSELKQGVVIGCVVFPQHL